MAPALTHQQFYRGRVWRLLDDLDRTPSAPEQRTVARAAGEGIEAYEVADDTLLRTFAQTVARSQTGAFVFSDAARAVAIMPPYPVQAAFAVGGYATGPLRELLACRPRIGVVLLRLGGYAVGVYEGDTLVLAKNDARFVKNRHRKGGQSQRRFDRIREKQVHELFGDLCTEARERLEPHAGRLDYLAYGGDAHTMQAFLKECRWLQELGVPPLGRFLTVPEPRHQTLVDLPAQLSASRVAFARLSHGDDESEPG